MTDDAMRSLREEVRLSDPQVSPDGQTVIILASRPNYDVNRFTKSIQLFDLVTGRRRELDVGDLTPSHPRWSPDGSCLAFLAPDASGAMQIRVVSLVNSSVRQLTETARGVHTFAWRPDGQTIAFVTEDDPSPVDGEEQHNRSFEVGDHAYLADRATESSHIWMLSLNGSDPVRLTGGTESFCLHFGVLSWSYDGRFLVYPAQSRPDSGALLETSIRLLDLDSGNSRTLGKPGSVAALFSPTDQRIALVRPSHELGFSPGGLSILSLSDETSRDIAAHLDRDLLAFGAGKTGIAWNSDGASVVLWGNDETNRSVWIQPLDGPTRRLDLGPCQPTEVSVGPRSSVSFVASTPTDPPELYWLPRPDAEPRRISDLNANLRNGVSVERSALEWDGPDDFGGNGIVTYPPGYSSGSRYPLVLDIHGGPMSAATVGFNLFHSLMARQGWIVFSPNYRGSNNMGTAYQRAVINDAGDGPSRDIMAGVSHLLQQASVDSNNLAISGWSYGGFLTVWLAALHNRWKSAVAGAAVSSWIDWYNLSDLNVWSGMGLGGSPWREGGLQHYLALSAITLAPKVQTPTLLLSTTGDRRVSVTQSYKLYHALKDNETEVSFVAYPVEGHFPGDPIHERDVYRRWIRWIRDHFESQPEM